MKNKILISLSLAIFMISLAFATTNEIKKVKCQTLQNNTVCLYKTSAIKSYYTYTNMPYALCASSKCTLDDKNTNYAICLCNLYNTKSTNNDWHLASTGPYDYNKSKPIYHNGKISKVTSNFSLAMANSLATYNNVNHQTCMSSKKMPWANCFGVRCNVTRKNIAGKIQTTVICNCPIVKSKEYMSTGPTSATECNLENNEVWSATTPNEGVIQFSLINNVYKSLDK